MIYVLKQIQSTLIVRLLQNHQLISSSALMQVTVFYLVAHHSLFRSHFKLASIRADFHILWGYSCSSIIMTMVFT
jgi:hypothetical protein